MTRRLFVLIAILTLGCNRDAGPSEKVSQRLGEKTLAVLKGAERVEVFRLDPTQRGKGDNTFGGLLITSTGKEQGRAFAGKLAAILMRDETYFGQAYKCFEPGVGFRIWHGKDSVDVQICFVCSNLSVGDAFGEFGGSKGIFGQLAKLAKEAFPDDDAIQKLSDRSRLDDK